MYYTVDWAMAEASATRLAAFDPEVVITGHGIPMRGAEMRAALHRLAHDFASVARPRDGRYVRQPARAETAARTSTSRPDSGTFRVGRG